MKSALPKVLHPILGRPMVRYVVDAVRRAGAEKVHVVVGFGKDALIKALSGHDLHFVEQNQQLGTGHAVQCYARQCPKPPPHLLIVCGDTPLLSDETLQSMVREHFENGNDLTMMTLIMNDPGKYGRILRDKKGRIKAIREAKDCTEEEKLIKEINLALYMFNGPELFKRLPLLKNNNNQKEYYLTDLIEMFSRDGLKMEAVVERDETSTLGINSRADLALVSGIIQKRLLRHHMDEGVTIVDPAQTLIEPGVIIGSDTTIWPGTTLSGETVIGCESEIGPQACIRSSRLGNRVVARCCLLDQTVVPDDSVVMPFSFRKGKSSRPSSQKNRSERKK